MPKPKREPDDSPPRRGDAGKLKTQNSKLKTISPPAELQEATLADLERIHAEPIIVAVSARGKMLKVTGRLLKPDELKQVRLLMDRALPPILPAKSPGNPSDEDRYDLKDERYMNEAETNRRTARALALFAAYPLFQTDEAKALSDRHKLTEYIETRSLDDGMLDTLFNRLVKDEKGLQNYLGFI